MVSYTEPTFYTSCKCLSSHSYMQAVNKKSMWHTDWKRNNIYLQLIKTERTIQTNFIILQSLLDLIPTLFSISVSEEPVFTQFWF